jgi:hypothetical protein
MEINYGILGAHQTVTPLAPSTQASYVVQTYLLNAAAGVKRVYWLEWHYKPTLGVQLVDVDNTTPTEAGVAYRTVHRWLLGTKVHSCSVSGKHRLYACELFVKRRPAWVYWTMKGTAHLRAPHGARHLETMSGRRHRIHAGKRLAVTNAPIFVHH